MGGGDVFPSNMHKTCLLGVIDKLGLWCLRRYNIYGYTILPPIVQWLIRPTDKLWRAVINIYLGCVFHPIDRTLNAITVSVRTHFVCCLYRTCNKHVIQTNASVWAVGVCIYCFVSYAYCDNSWNMRELSFQWYNVRVAAYILNWNVLRF